MNREPFDYEANALPTELFPDIQGNIWEFPPGLILYIDCLEYDLQARSGGGGGGGGVVVGCVEPPPPPTLPFVKSALLKRENIDKFVYFTRKVVHFKRIWDTKTYKCPFSLNFDPLRYAPDLILILSILIK